MRTSNYSIQDPDLAAAISVETQEFPRVEFRPGDRLATLTFTSTQLLTDTVIAYGAGLHQDSKKLLGARRHILRLIKQSGGR